MPKVTYDGIDEKELSMFVPIVTPWVCSTFADDLKAMANRWYRQIEHLNFLAPS